MKINSIQMIKLTPNRQNNIKKQVNCDTQGKDINFNGLLWNKIRYFHDIKTAKKNAQTIKQDASQQRDFICGIESVSKILHKRMIRQYENVLQLIDKGAENGYNSFEGNSGEVIEFVTQDTEKGKVLVGIRELRKDVLIKDIRVKDGLPVMIKEPNYALGTSDICEFIDGTNAFRYTKNFKRGENMAQSYTQEYCFENGLIKRYTKNFSQKPNGSIELEQEFDWDENRNETCINGCEFDENRRYGFDMAMCWENGELVCATTDYEMYMGQDVDFSGEYEWKDNNLATYTENYSEEGNRISMDKKFVWRNDKLIDCLSHYASEA